MIVDVSKPLLPQIVVWLIHNLCYELVRQNDVLCRHFQLRGD